MSYSLQLQPKSFQLKALIDETWDKEIIITVDRNCNKVQAQKIFSIFYPNFASITEIEVNEIG